MKLKFKIQQYKKDAVKNVVRVFDEQHNLCLLKYENINHIQVGSNSHLSNDVVKKKSDATNSTWRWLRIRESLTSMSRLCLK